MTQRERDELIAEARHEIGKRDDEIVRLRAMILDASKLFEHYDLPEHAFHYRRAILGLDEAKKMARTAAGVT